MLIRLSENARLFHADCRDAIKSLPDNSIDSCVTDPPYALVSIVKRFGGPNAQPAKGNDAYMRASAGFMGKQWDTGEVAFSEEFWAEVLRVLKPGGHVAAFGASRGYHRMACAIEDAGFEIRDSLMWVYGTGFPKSHSMREIDRPELGTALKPAFEPIVLARKPLSEKTVAANVLRWGTGALNIDGCRVATTENLNGGAYSGGAKNLADATSYATGVNAGEYVQPTGRWPANVVHDGSDEVVGAFPNTSPSPKGLITQGGDHFSIGSDKKTRGTKFQGHGDSGSAARFFYSAKASRADRNGSKHPTIKPIALMQWLARLITPPGGTVLDPFAGSGTTGAACEREGFSVILCEREDEYVADIRARFGHERPADWKPQGAGRRIYGVFADEKGVEGGRLDKTPDPLARLLHWNAAVASYRAKVAA